jgi:Type IV minor pilin ComP, DNA uptake sequence receptor
MKIGLRNFVSVENRMNTKIVFYFVILSFSLISCNRLYSSRAIDTLKKFRVAQNQYYSTNKQYGDLSQLMDARLFDYPIDKGEYYGYSYEIKVSNNSYTIIATPIKAGSNSSYFLSEDGVIRFGSDPNKLSKDSPQTAADTR